MGTQSVGTQTSIPKKKFSSLRRTVFIFPFNKQLSNLQIIAQHLIHQMMIVNQSKRKHDNIVGGAAEHGGSLVPDHADGDAGLDLGDALGLALVTRLHVELWGRRVMLSVH